MPAPANDNWASFTLLTGASGSTTGNNILATAQAGEPANSGKTVWFKWVATSGGPFVFATTQNTLSTPLSTVLQVFTGAAVNTLTEATYITTANWPTNYAHWDIGSQVAFNAISGTTYYIRVDGVGGAEGNFPLAWSAYGVTTLSDCNVCPPKIGKGLECLGSITSTVSSITHTDSFGTYAQGKYSMKYCGGAYNFSGFAGNWTVAYTPGNPNTYFGVIYQVAGTPTELPLGNLPVVQAYNSQPEAETAFRCAATDFNHDGGDISLIFRDNPSSDNIAGSPNPVFGLYRRTPFFAVSTACATWTVVGTSASCTFTFLNQTDTAWSAITATLLSTGGVSSPSSPVTGLSIAANGTAAATFTFNASTANTIATLKFSSTYFPADITVDFNLNPVFTVDTLTLSGGSGACSPFTTKLFTVVIHNSGYWTVNPDMLVDLGGVKQLVDTVGGCHGHTSMTINPGDVNCVNGTQTPLMRYGATGVTAPAILTVAVSYLGINYGSFTFSLTTV